MFVHSSGSEVEFRACSRARPEYASAADWRLGVARVTSVPASQCRRREGAVDRRQRRGWH